MPQSWRRGRKKQIADISLSDDDMAATGIMALVTGGAGFIGSHLVEALLARGDRVVVVDDLSTGDIANLAAVADHPRLRFVRGSVADESLLRELLHGSPGVAEVYHLAAAVGVGLIASNPIQTIETNIMPTERLLAELRRLHAGGQPVRMFLASSSEVYGKNPKAVWNEDDDLVFGPTTRARWSYGVSKAVDEFLVLACWRQNRLPVVVGRLFNVVGPRQSGRWGMVLPRLVSAALAGHSPIVHDDGRQQRCFAHVADVIRAILALMQSPAAIGGVFNIGSDQPISIRELALRVIAAVDPKLEIEYQSYAAAYSDDFEDVRRRVPDLSRLRHTIDFQLHYDLDKIIGEVIAWQRTTM
jgi:UDP-glucose 4-epimerase